MSIEFTDLKDLILNWAEERKQPFLASDVYTEIDEAEDVKQASDAVRTLWVQGLLVRKKIDGVRFAYSLLAYAPDDFEMVQKKDNTEQAAEPACSSTETILQLPAKSPESATKTRPDARKSQATKTVKQSAKPDATPAQAVKAAESTAPIELPDNFILQLKTSGGLVITIKSGAA